MARQTNQDHIRKVVSELLGRLLSFHYMFIIDLCTSTKIETMAHLHSTVFLRREEKTSSVCNQIPPFPRLYTR